MHQWEINLVNHTANNIAKKLTIQEQTDYKTLNGI